MGGMRRRFILNADDYAMDAAVDAAILELAARHIVTATSVMVLSPTWFDAAKHLRDCPIDCGLHLDFTSPFAVAVAPAPSLSALLLRAFSRRLDPAALRDAINEQLARYEMAMGRAPDFVDGHQHVHQFPMIREALFAVLAERYDQAARSIALRSCMPRRWRGLKAAAVAATGAMGLDRLARVKGHSRNSDFAGVYGFSPLDEPAELWRHWLRGLQGDSPLIMCHVATASDTAPPDDPIRQARLKEYAWLTSSAFLDLTAEFGLTTSRWLSVSNRINLGAGGAGVR